MCFNLTRLTEHQINFFSLMHINLTGLKKNIHKLVRFKKTHDYRSEWTRQIHYYYLRWYIISNNGVD